MAGLAASPRCAPNWTGSTSHARAADAARRGGGAGGARRQARRLSSRAGGLDHPPPAGDSTAAHCRAQALVRIWRELLAGTTAMQGPFTVAVCEPDAGAGFTQTAREHFGALTPLRVLWQPGAGDGRGVVAVPRRWPCCRCRPRPRRRVTPGGPRCCRRTNRASLCRGPAAVLGASAGRRARPRRRWWSLPREPDASGRDRSLLGLELDSTSAAPG